MEIQGTGAGAPIDNSTAATQDAASQPVDLDNTAPIRTETRSTPDGKTVVVEYLHEDGDISVAREFTLGAGNRITEAQIAFNTGAGNDEVPIDGDTGSGATVSINGQTFTTSVPAAPGDFGPYAGITVRTGAGNDVIEVAAGSDINLTASGGAGDDRIIAADGSDRLNGGDGDDLLLGNGGRDDIFGASGDDLISGGAGNDILYGGDGNDFVSGRDGDDYLEGGRGNDSVFGGAGSDVLSGGRDADRLYGGSGDDAVYTGHGADFVRNLGGDDTVYAQTDETTMLTSQRSSTASNTVINVELNAAIGASSVIIEGSAEFVQRVEADIELLRSSPVGQQALSAGDQAFVDNGHTVTIREPAGEKNGFASSADGPFGFVDANGNPGRTNPALIRYNPSFSNEAIPAPVIVLQHEYAHAYNIVTGTLQPGNFVGTGPIQADFGVPNAERQAVGLQSDGIPIDGDNDPATPPSNINPPYLTENGLRAEMGLELRPGYSNQ